MKPFWKGTLAVLKFLFTNEKIRELICGLFDRKPKA